MRLKSITDAACQTTAAQGERHPERSGRRSRSVGEVSDQNDLAQVRHLLGGAGIAPPERELELLARLLPTLRAQIDRAYLADTADVAPVATFRPGDGAGSSR